VKSDAPGLFDESSEDLFGGIKPKPKKHEPTQPKEAAKVKASSSLFGEDDSD